MDKTESYPWKSKLISWLMLIVIAWVLYSAARDPDKADPRWSAHAQQMADKPCPSSAKCEPNQPQETTAANP